VALGTSALDVPAKAHAARSSIATPSRSGCALRASQMFRLKKLFRTRKRAREAEGCPSTACTARALSIRPAVPRRAVRSVLPRGNALISCASPSMTTAPQRRSSCKARSKRPRPGMLQPAKFYRAPQRVSNADTQGGRPSGTSPQPSDGHRNRGHWYTLPRFLVHPQTAANIPNGCATFSIATRR